MRLNLEQVNQSIERQNNGGNFKDFRRIKNFSLADDRDGAHVRFLFENATDASFFRTHIVTLNTAGGKRFSVDVDCIAGNGQQCPLCRESIKYKGMYPKPVDSAKDSIYMPLLVIDKKTNAGVEKLNELQVWKRGVKFYKTDLSPHASRNGNLFSNITELERIGARGSQDTAYRAYSSNSDYDGNPYPAPKSLDEVKAELGYTDDVLYGADDSLIKTWTADQMEEAIKTGQFPKGNATTTEQPAQEEAPQPRNRTAQVDYGF